MYTVVNWYSKFGFYNVCSNPLQVGVTGNNLLNVSKLIFTISRSEHNDKLFDEEEMIQPIVKLVGLIELSDALTCWEL